MSEFSVNTVRPEQTIQTFGGDPKKIERKVVGSVNASDQKTETYNKAVKVDKETAAALNEAGIEKPGGGNWKEGDKIYTTGKGKARLEISQMLDTALGNTIEVKKGASPTVELGEPTIKYVK